MRIFVVDDNKLFREMVINHIQEFFKGKFYKLNIVEYEDGEALVKDEDDKDIIFLDVDMPKLNGFDAAKLLREREEDAFIIFMTSHGEMMQQAFSVKAFRYMVKPVEYDEFTEVAQSVMDELFRYKKVIVKSYDSEREERVEKLINIKDIDFIMALGDTSVVQIGNESIDSNKSLKKWEEYLNFDNFMRVEKSYLVNLKAVDEIMNKELKIGKHNIPMSRRKKKDIRKALNRVVHE